MVIIFDLDDTLYDEKTFVYCAFNDVACFLADILHESQDVILKHLQHEFMKNRFAIFDRLLAEYGCYSRSRVNDCVRVYRACKPVISLYPEAKDLLEELSEFPLYVVTDGNKFVQRRKCKALGLDMLVKKCYCTHQFGIEHAKPSPYCFSMICSKEHVLPYDVVYIADNPQKDFVGIKPLGFHTVRIMQGPYKDLQVQENFDAEIHLVSLKECTKSFLLELVGRKL